MMKGAALLPMLMAVPAVGQPIVGAVVNGASFEAVVSPGSLVSIFGEKLARSTVYAPDVPLPMKLEDTTVTVGGVTAPLYFVSPGQINAQLPFEISPGLTTFVVTTVEGQSNQFQMTVDSTSPGLFTRSDGTGQALYFWADFGLADQVNPGDIVIFYATGLGATDPPGVTGAGGASVEPLQRVVELPEVYVGEDRAEVAYAGLAPGFVGVYQVNIKLPASLASNRFFLRSGGRQSNVAHMWILPGRNVNHAFGCIDAVYPSGRWAWATFSPLPLVAKFDAYFEILPTAGTFRVVATGATGHSIITFDPIAGTYEAEITVPTLAARIFDFTNTEIVATDLVTGQPMPGNQIPLDRVEPSAVEALNLLPVPNVPVVGSATSILRVTGEAKAGSTFYIGQDSVLSTFAEFLPIPYNPGQKGRQIDELSVYIDGFWACMALVGINTP